MCGLVELAGEETVFVGSGVVCYNRGPLVRIQSPDMHKCILLMDGLENNSAIMARIKDPELCGDYDEVRLCSL